MIAFVLAGIACVFAGASSAAPARSGTAHDRVISTDGDHRLQLVDLETNVVRRMAPSLGFASAALSPDGTEVAATRIGHAGLVLINVNSGAERRLTSGDDSSPTWSPDGAWIAFARGEGHPPLKGQGLFRIRANGRGLRLITSGVVSTPAWSPNGKTIAFDSWIVRGWGAANQQWLHTTTSLTVVSISGRGLRHLTSHVWSLARQGADDFDPFWAPDSSAIAFQRTIGAGDSEGSSVYVIGTNGTKLRRVTPATYFAEPTGWSSDGTEVAGWESKICKACSSNGPIQAWVSDTSSGMRSGFSRFTSVEWSPSGKLVAFGCDAAPSGVCVVGDDGSVQQQLAAAAG